MFDQFGRAQFHQSKPLGDWARQARRLEYLVQMGLVDRRGRVGFSLGTSHGQQFADYHLRDVPGRGGLVRPRTGGPSPFGARVRMYQVGFGDCFLLTFEYPRRLEDGRRERHVLLDFGSTRWPGRRPLAGQVAGLIADHTGGVLDVLVVTHRHRDHLSGFADDQSGAQVEALRPRMVVRPWTEQPQAAFDATGPGEESVRLAAALAEGQVFADMLARDLAGARGLRGDVQALAALQLANAAAIKRLDRMADAAEAVYLHAGADAGLRALLPGVQVHVLGPPTVEQRPGITRQRAEDPEY